MATIYGTIPDATALAAFESGVVKVARWVDAYIPNAAVAEKYSLWRSQIPIVAGEVTVDMSRDERRNLDLTISDVDGTLGYGPGALWYDKIFKVYRGVILPDVLDPGYIIEPGVAGNHVTMTRTAVATYTYLEFAMRVSFDAVGVVQYLAGWNTNDSLFYMEASNKLRIGVHDTTLAVFIGDTLSTVAVPGIQANTKVWLRGRVQISNAQCSYWYSYDNTNNFDNVNWLTVGTPVTGTNAAAAPTTAQSTNVFFGNVASSGALALAGKLYAGVEYLSLAQTIKFDTAGKTAGAATFTALSGQTMTVVSTAIANPGRIIAATTIPGDTWVSCLGEFMPDVISRPRFPKTIHVTGRDFTKKCLLSKFGLSTSLAVGTVVATAISSMATNAGIVKLNFATPTNTLAAIVTFDKGSDRWKAMKTLADSIGHELFFDGYGYLTLRPFVDPLTAPLSYTFKTGAVGNLVDFERSTTDTFMKNHIFVVGDGPDNGLVFGEAQNNNVNSPTNITAIGDRTDTIKSAMVPSNAAAALLATAYLKIAGLEQYEVNLSAIILTWLEAGTAVECLLDDSVPTDPTRFLFTNFKIPLSLSPMDGTARRVTIVG